MNKPSPYNSLNHAKTRSWQNYEPMETQEYLCRNIIADNDKDSTKFRSLFLLDRAYVAS